jgi:uncharacterized integral membrane protein
MAQVILLVALILVAVLALFGAQNTEAVSLHFLGFTTRAIPLSVAILGGALLGALLSVLVGLPGRIRLGFARGSLSRQNVRQQKQIAQLHVTDAAKEEKETRKDQ